MEEETQSLTEAVESIPIDAPEPEICLPEFPVKRQETVIGFQAGHRIVRVQSKDPVTGQAIYNGSSWYEHRND